MTEKPQRHSIRTLRELLIAAFDAAELRALVSYDDKLKDLAPEFASADPITVMAA